MHAPPTHITWGGMKWRESIETCYLMVSAKSSCHDIVQIRTRLCPSFSIFDGARESLGTKLPNRCMKIATFWWIDHCQCMSMSLTYLFSVWSTSDVGIQHLLHYLSETYCTCISQKAFMWVLQCVYIADLLFNCSINAATWSYPKLDPCQSLFLLRKLHGQK